VKDPTRPERIKTAEVALILGVSVRKVQAMAALAELPGGARIGNRWTFNEAKIREFIVEKEREIERKAVNEGKTAPEEIGVVGRRRRVDR
jgi:hypothetical protein